MATTNHFPAPVMGPDIIQREQQAKRRQMMAQLLQEQGMQTPQGQMVSGHYIRPHITQYLAQGLNQYMGGREARGADEDMQQVEQMKNDHVLQTFGFTPSPQQLAAGLDDGRGQGLKQQPAFDPGSPSPQAYAGVLESLDQPQVGIDDGIPGFTPAQGGMPQQGMPQGQGPMLLPGMDKQQSLAMLNTVGGEEYAKLLAKGLMQRGTSAMQNAEALGLQPGTPEYNAYIERVTGSPQTVVNVGGDAAPGLGKLSTDFGYVLDPETGKPVIDPTTGLPQAAPVPGSPAAQSQADAASRAEAAQRNAASYARTVTQDIGIADNYLDAIAADESGNAVASASMRELRSRVPGTAEYNMKQFVDSALSNVTLDTMNRMRETSQAGATGFGNMSERQMEVIWVFRLIVTTDCGIVTTQSGIVTGDSGDRDHRHTVQ